MGGVATDTFVCKFLVHVLLQRALNDDEEILFRQIDVFFCFLALQFVVEDWIIFALFPFCYPGQNAFLVIAWR